MKAFYEQFEALEGIDGIIKNIPLLLAACKRKDKLLEQCLTILNDECVKDIVDGYNCNSDPDKKNCEAHAAEVSRIISEEIEVELSWN